MERIIYDNYNLYDRFDETKQLIMDEYPDLCDCEVEDEDGNISYEPKDDKVWDFLYEDERMEFDDAICQLKDFFKNQRCLFFGSIGLWSGTCAGGKIGNFNDLFYDLIEDCSYIKIYEENGHLFVHCSHHDGSNTMEVRLLTDKGYEYSENWSYGYGDKKYDYSEEEMHTHIVKCSLLSRLPYFTKKYWGCK